MYLTNRSHIVIQTLTDCAAVRQIAAVGSVYIEVNAIPQTLCCEKVTWLSPGGGFLWSEYTYCSVSNFLYSLAGVRDQFANTFPQSQQKERSKFPRLLHFIFPINRRNRFRQAVNESEMRHCVVLILTVIMPPGINLSPVVADPDNLC